MVNKARWETARRSSSSEDSANTFPSGPRITSPDPTWARACTRPRRTRARLAFRDAASKSSLLSAFCDSMVHRLVAIGRSDAMSHISNSGGATVGPTLRGGRQYLILRTRGAAIIPFRPTNPIAPQNHDASQRIATILDTPSNLVIRPFPRGGFIIDP